MIFSMRWAAGCRTMDLNSVYAENFKESEVRKIFSKVRNGETANLEDRNKYKSAMLLALAEMDHARGWTQQFHLGALRNNNSRMKKNLGPDTGFDSIGDFEMARPLSKFLDSLDKNNRLAKTILYNLNPADNYLFASMIGNFNDGSFPGKIQFGSGWWFLDQKEAMEWQLNALSNLGLLSRFVGMLTDSRSFLSYPRHDYFRRILCNLIGNDVEKGLLPAEIEWLGKMVENISFYNARHFFNFK
jgi:glucuronate isomerase